MRFHTSEPETVVDHDRRVRDGLEHWVDGTMGFHRWAGRTIVLSPNGGHIARHDISTGSFSAAPLATHGRIQREIIASDHASGGPVFYDALHGQLLLVYHGESFTRGDPADYYSFLGLAVSNDHGVTFEDLGRIITSDLAEEDPNRHRPLDVGSGAYVVRDGWMLVYFADRGNGPVRRSLSVARARVADVVEAARARQCPTFSKFHDGRWDEPGIGGASSELFDRDPRWVIWFDTATLAPTGAVLLVYSTSALIDGVPHWAHMATVSPDGVNWSEAMPLLDEPTTDEMIYLTIDSGQADQRTIAGTSFDVYRTRATTQFRWDSAWVERVRVTYELAG